MASNINPDPFTTRPEIEGTFGVVTSTHWIATAVGMAMLEKGGNAFDAGVATAFTLQVVEPHLNGPGGDVPVIVHDVQARPHRGDLRPGAGAGQGDDRALPRARDSTWCPAPACWRPAFPARSRSWMLLLRDYGTMRLRDVLEPAISYASNGYPLVERACATIQTVEQLFREHWPTSAAVYLPNGEVPKPGTIFTNPKLAETYARILNEAESAGRDRVAQIERARKAWSHGFVAEAIDKFCRTQDVMDVSGSPHSGVLTGRRHGALAADRRSAAHLRLRPLHRAEGRRLEPGPGDAAAARAAQGLSISTGSIPTGPDFIHLQVECAKLAYADREKFYGDPEVHRDPDRDAAVGCL